MAGSSWRVFKKENEHPIFPRVVLYSINVNGNTLQVVRGGGRVKRVGE